MDTHRLREISDRLLENTPNDYRRYLYTQIDWRNRMVCLKGARGTGKSTILRQRLLEVHGHSEEAIYLSLDYLWLSVRELLDAIDSFPASH